MANYLTQQLSQYSVVANNSPYVFPTAQNLAAGKYSSEILDVQEVLDVNGALVALDFHHKIADSNGNVKHVRFRYYEKELQGLAQQLCQYPQVKTWQDAVGLKEDVIVQPKASGSYMRIASRSAIPTTTPQVVTVPTRIPSKGGVASKRKSMFGQSNRNVLLSSNDEDEDEDEDDDDIEC